MPHLLSEVCSREDAPVPLSRMMPLLSGIITRTTYLELLSEFPGALKHLITPLRRLADGGQQAGALPAAAG